MSPHRPGHGYDTDKLEHWEAKEGKLEANEATLAKVAGHRMQPVLTLIEYPGHVQGDPEVALSTLSYIPPVLEVELYMSSNLVQESITGNNSCTARTVSTEF